MPHRTRYWMIALLLAAWAGALGGRFVPAEEPPRKAMDAVKDAALHFVTPASVDAVKLLPAPPKQASQEAQEEMQAVLRMQDVRTPEQVARAQSEQKLTLAAFTSVVGPWFTAKNLPITAKLIAEAESDSKVFTSAAKEHFGRVRPSLDARMKPVVDEKDEPSYPSGHATRGILFASILAQIDPDQSEALMDRGREIGWDRIIAGVHFPSDIVAGRVVGKALAQAMATNPTFQEELAAAKEEFTAAKKKLAATPAN